MIQLEPFARLFVDAKYRGEMGKPERRLEIVGRVRLALEELRGMEDDPDMPLHILAKWFRKLYGDQGPRYFGQILEECVALLGKVGLSCDPQPYWREEAYKLYKHFVDQVFVNLNPVAEAYLHQRYNDEDQ